MRLVLRLVAAGVLFSSLAVLAAGPPVKLQGLSAADFKKLPPDALLDVGGRVLTKQQLLSEIQTKRSQAPAKTGKADFEAARAKLEADEKAQIDAVSSTVRAAWQTVAPRESLPPLQGAPRIVSVAPLPLRAWGDMTIRGTGFGTDVGEVHLLGPFPGGHLTLQVCTGGGWGIVSCTWRPGVVSTVGSSWVSYSSDQSGRIPVITGIQDGTLQVVVVTKKGERSAPFPVPFRARRVLTRLTLQDVQVVRSSPAEGGCESGAPGATVGCREGMEPLNQPPAWHVGADRISARVRNGWTFDSHSSIEIGSTPSGYTEPAPFGFETPLLTIGADRTTAEAVCAYVSLAEIQWCSVDLLVTGPEGVPLR